LRRAYLYRLKKAFDSSGIEIPYPYLAVYAGEPKSGQAVPLPVILQRYLIRPDLPASSFVLSLSKHSPSIVRQAHDQGER